MNPLKALVFLLFMPLLALAQATASFSTSPAANNNTITVCQGSSVLYTNTSTGTNASTNYNWTFQGGNPNNSNQVGPHNITYNNPGNYTTTLNLGNGVTSQVNIAVVANNYTPSLTIPNSSGFSTTTFNGITIFRRCGNFNSGNFSFTDPSFASYPAGTTFNYIWGDNTPNGSGNPNPITHLYNGQGYYNLTYQISLPSGCTFTNNYLVYVGGNPPTISLTGSGSNSCLPSPYSFSIGTPNSPSAGTAFQIIYNDGTPTTILNGLNPNPQMINHVFGQTSCGINSVIQQQTYSNAYSIQVVATNGCNPQGTFAAIGPIAAGGSVNAAITANPTTNVICVNEPITFQDISNHGTNVYGGSCDSLFGIYWSISPNSGFTSPAAFGSSNGWLPNTNNGYDWTSWSNGLDSLPVIFTQPGNYQVTMHIGNDCGMDSVVYNICVVAATVANFTLPLATACAPVQITPTNNSSVPGCTNSNVYNWSVTSTNPQNCVFQGGPAVQPANSNLAAPSFNFTGPGVYTVQLITALANNVAGNSCVADTFTQQITIKGPPQFTINPVGPICAGGSISPTIVINNCYGTSPNTYAWNFNPGNSIPAGSIPTPTSANTLNPGSITYPSSTGSPFPFNLAATNECGVTTVASTVVVNNPVVVTPGSYGPFCLNSPVQLNGTVSGGVNTGYWTANVAGGSFSIPGLGGANTGALNAIYSPPAGYSGNIILTLTSGQPIAPCQAVSTPTTILFNPVATASAGVYPNGVCMNGSLSLNGSIGGAASSASWSSSIGGTFSNVNSLTSSWSPPANFTGTTTLTLTTNDPAGPCNPAVATINVTVHPLPVATAPQSVGPICSGSNAVINVTSTINPTSFAWTASFPAGVTGTASGTLNPGSNNATLTTAIANNTNAPQTVTYTFIPSSNGCPGAPVTTQVVVQPVATVGPFGPITVCPGAAITPPAFVSNPNGASFSWVSSNPAGVGSPPNGTGQMSPWTALANNSNATVFSNIAVTPTFNNCPGTTASFVITINPTPSIVNTPSTQTRCSGVASAAVTFTASVGATTFSWTGVASSPNLTGFTTPGTGNLPVMTITNSGNTPETVTYTVIPTRNGCPGPVFTYTITINPTPVLTLSANQTICGGQTTLVSTISNSVAGGTLAYALQNPPPATVTGHPTNGNGQIPSATINNGGTSPYTLNYTVTPTANNCSGSTGTYSITVNPAPVTAFSQGNQTICTGQNTTLVTLSSATPSVSFSWSLQGAVPAGLGNFNPTSGTSSIPIYSNLTNNTAAPITVTLQAQASTSGPAQCPGATANYTITVNPSPIAVATFVSNDTVCSGQNINVSLSSTTAGTTFTWTAANGAGVTGGQNSAVPSATINQALTNSSSTVGNVTYMVTPSASSCAGSPLQVFAYVNPVATIAALTSPTVCSQATITPTVFVSTPNGASFAWTVSNAQIGIAGPGNGQIAPWTATANNTNAPITGTVTVTPTYNGCVGTANSFTVTINPTPTVTNNALTQSICSGANTAAVTWTSNLVGTTYAWTAVASAATLTGFTPSGNGNLPALTLTNNSNSIGTVTYTVTPSSNGCSGPAITYTITVNPIPQLTLSQNQTVCGGVATALSSFSNSVAGGGYTYALQSPGLVPATITGYPTNGNGQVPVATINNAGTNPYTLTYTITPTANGCSGSTGSYTITVNPAPVTTFSPGNQSICSGQNTNLVTLGSSTAGVTFTWTIPGGVPAGLGNVNVTSGTSTIPVYQNLTNNTITPLVLTVVAVATTGGASQCAGTPSSYTITVNPVPTAVATFISNDTICSNSAINISLTSNTPNTSFTWTAVNGLNTSGGANSVNPGISIQQPLVNSSTNYGNVTYTITPVVAGACPGQPILVVAYVHPVATIAALNSPTVCPQATITPTAFVSTPNGASFAWTVSNAQTGIAGPGNGQLAPWTAPANNTNAPITGTVTVSPTFNGCVGTANNFTVTINPTPTVTNINLTQSLCSGANSAAVTWTSNLAGTTYAWTGVGSAATVTGFTVSGSGNLPVMSITNASNAIQTVTYTVTPTNNGCSGQSITYTITVNPIPQVTLSQNQTVCGGVATTSSAFTNSVAGGSFTYALQSPGAIPATVTGYPSNGSGQIPVATITNSGTNPYTLNYTITPTANNCSGSTGTYSITVNPAPAVTFSIPNQTVCNNANSQAVTISTATANTTYSWAVQNPLPNGLGVIQPTSGNNSIIPSFTGLTNNTNQPVSFTISASASTTGNAVCPGVPNTYTITVNPTVTALATFVSNDTLCSNTQLNLGLSSVTPAVQYTWTVVAPNGVTGASPSGAPSATIQQTLANSNSSIALVTYTVTPQIGVCNGTVLNVPVYVNPVAVMNLMANLTACAGQALSPASFGSVPAPASFSWVNSNQQVGIPGSGNGSIASWNAPANNTLANLTATVTVTPTYNGCVGTSSSFSVTVYPTPTVTNSPLNQTVCEGVATSPITFTSNLNGTSFAWSYLVSGANLSGFNAGNGNNLLPTMTVAHSGNIAQTITYAVIPTSTNNCAGTAITYTININPNPSISSVVDQVICSGTSTTVSNYQNNVAGGGFTWSLLNANIPNTVTGFLAPSGSGQLAAAVVSNSGSQPYTLNYLITPNASGCTGQPDTLSITVMPAPALQFTGGPSQSICSGQSSLAINMTSTTPNVTWSWTVTASNNVSGVNPNSGSSSTIPSFTLTQGTNAPQIVTISAQANTTNGGCQGAASTYTITVNPIPTVSPTVSPASTICSGTSVTLSLSSNVAGTTYAWTSNASAGITGNTNSSGSTISNTLLNATSNTGTVTYSIVPTANTCSGSAVTTTISVNPVAQMTGLNNISVCPGNNIAPPAFQSIPAGASFTWTNSNTNIGIPASGQGNLVPWNAPINNTVNPIVGLIIITPTIGNACAGVNDTIVVTVFPTPQITNAPLQQTLCEGAPSAPVNITSNLLGSTLTWNFLTAGGGLSGHPIGSGNNPIPAITFSNNVSTQQSAQYTLSAISTNQCPSAPVTYTFNVNPIPVLNNPGVQTVCSGLPTTQAAFTADVQGTSFTWTAITPPVGLSGFTASGTGSLSPMTIINSTANPLQLVYSVTPLANGCSGAALNYTITVNPSPTVIFSTGNQTICSGATTNLVNLTTSTNNATIAWNVSVPGGLQGVNTLSGTTQIPAYTLLNNTQGNLTATFTATASTGGGAVCPGVSSTYTITVSPQNGISVVAIDSSLCSGANAQITISSNTAGLTYTTTVAASQGITGAINVNGPQISQTLINSGNTQGTVTYTVTASAPPGSSCPSQTTTLPITVEPVASVQFSLPSQSLCSGASSQLVNLTSNVVGASITWAASVPNGLSGMSLQGANTIAATPITSNLNTSAVIGISSSAVINGCTGPVANGQITVFPNPGLTITPPNDTICSGVAAVATLTSNVANTSYAWTISSNPSIGGATNGTGSTINQVLTNNSAQIQQLTYTITTNGPGPNNGCPGQSGTYNIWVNPVASVGFSQLNQTLCSGTTSQAVNILSQTPNAQISWSANIPAGITGAVANGVNTIPVQTLVNNTQGPLTVVYTVNVATQAGNCQGQAATYSITVNPIPVLGFSQNPQVLCSGSNSVAVALQSNLNAGIPGNISYIWSANQPAGISGMATSGTNSIPVQTLTNNTSAPVVLSYIATLTYTNNNISCIGTGATYSITVNPLPQVTATISSPVICSNDTASICFTSPVANVNFNWTVSASNGITGSQNGTGSCLNQVLVNNLLTQGTVVYTVTASANNCTGSSVTATISINPNPSVTQVNNIVVCPGQAIPTINFTSTPAGAVFAWTNSNQTIGLIGNGPGSISGWQAPVNVSGGAFVGTISVNGTLNGCSGANMSFTVTVNPTPVLTLNPQAQTLCSGTTASVLCTSNVGNTTLTWIQSSINVSGASNGNGTSVNGVYTLSQALQSTTNAAGSVSYTITPSALGCVGNSEQALVTVNPIPVASVNPGAQSICSGTSTSLILSGNMPGITYGWTVSANNNIIGAFSGSNDTIAQLLTNSSTGNQVITYSITPSLNGCVGAAVNVTITVKPTPILTTNVANNTICSGTSTNIALSSNVLNTTYAYTVNPGPGIQGAGSGISNPIIQQLTNNSLNPSQVTYQITPSANGCDGALVSVTIIVNPVATVIPSQNSVTICSGQSVNVQLASNSPGALFNWTVSANAQLSGQQAGSGANINQQITNATFAVQNFYYVVTPVFGVCPGTQDTIPVTVNPLPQITPGPAVNTCITTPSFNLTGFSPVGGTWSGTGITNGALATFSPAIAGAGPHTLTYSYTHPVTGCIDSATRQVTVNPLPIPSFTMDTLKCINTTVSIVNNSQGANSYLWDFGNGATSTQFNPIYQFPAGGNYTVTLTATSPQGCVDSITNNIHIVTTPTASFIPSPNNGCGPLNVNFNNTSNGYNISSYFWNFGFPANGPFSNAQNPGALTFQPPLLQDTNYVISLSVTNLCGTTNFLDTILVHPLPIASFATTVNTGCSPLPVGFQNLSLGTPTNYIWNFGDGQFSTQVSPTHTFVYGPNDTIFNVALIAINACGSDTAYYPIHVFPNTVSSFFNTNPTVGCAPLNVQFTNYSQGGNLNYFWSFGNGQVSNSQSPSHLYTSSGTFVAQLVVDNGCSFDTSTITITVLAKPQVAFSVVNDTLCTGQVFQFTNISSQLSNTVWSFGDGLSSNAYSPGHVYANGGTFLVSLIGTSAANGCTDTAYQLVYSIPSPVLDYDTLVYEGCAPLWVSFNELSGTATSALWDYDDGSIGIAPSSAHQYLNPGSYTPQVIALNTFGCSDTANFTVVVRDVPVVDFDITDKTSCEVPFLVTPVNNSQGAIVYDWDFGNGSGSNQFEPTATYTQTGNYLLVLMGYNQFGCGDTTFQSIIVNPIPNSQFIPDITAGCEDLTVSFTNNSTNGNLYFWNFGDGTSVQSLNPTHTYTEPGVYDVTLITTNMFGCVDTLINQALITVYEQPTAGFTVFPSIVYTEDPFVDITNTAQNYNTGEYYLGNGTVSGLTLEQYSYGASEAGEYTITQVVYNNFGCSDTAYQVIQLNLSPTLYVPNAFTPEADGENDSWIPVATAMNSIEVSVYNRWGEEVFTTTDLSKAWDGKYRGQECPVGVYSWKIVARDINQELIIKSGHIVLLR
jgi:gliding motility-associated-like protein